MRSEGNSKNKTDQENLPGSKLCAALSPQNWPESLHREAEKQEEQGWLAQQNRVVCGENAIICTTASPVAVQAGLVALKNGGSAADAAATVALTQVATELGSVVSYAGILSLLYYDAGKRKVVSLDAGFNSYLDEADPKTIPANDMTKLRTGAVKPNEHGLARENGRKTLVPGFMAGIEAMHQRFGKLPFECLFQPAIWYAENGITVGNDLARFFQMQKDYLALTAEGRDFLHQSTRGDSGLPQAGDRFTQKLLAQTLRSVSKQGARYFYEGEWARHFVEIVRREGGKVTLADLARYRVLWTEPRSTVCFGRKVFCPGAPNDLAYKVFPALHFAEALHFDQKPPYWQDPVVFRNLQRIFDIADFAPLVFPDVKHLLESNGIDCSAAAFLDRKFAQAAAPLLEQLKSDEGLPPAQGQGNPSGTGSNDAANSENGLNTKPNHSDSIVVVDKYGNIAALTHTIYSVVWGDTGIIVDGVPLPNAAGFQQYRLVDLKPGERLPHEMPQAICFFDEKPVLAAAGVGSSNWQELSKIIIGVFANNATVAALQEAPPLLLNFSHMQQNKPVGSRGVILPLHCYEQNFVQSLKTMGVLLHPADLVETAVLRGTISLVTVDPAGGEKCSAESKNILNFAAAY